MAFTKYVAAQAFPTVANNAETIDISLLTNDDNQVRVVTGFYALPATAGAVYRLKISGRTIAEIDASLFDSTYGFIPVELHVPRDLSITYSIRNASGGAYTPTVVNARYEVMQDSQQAGAS